MRKVRGKKPTVKEKTQGGQGLEKEPKTDIRTSQEKKCWGRLRGGVGRDTRKGEKTFECSGKWWGEGESRSWNLKTRRKGPGERVVGRILKGRPEDPIVWEKPDGGI